ncbi:DUF2142 domain-containing protein, partial [bacterium]|nr:DUF2142 domain-containing protein [bacterium]
MKLEKIFILITLVFGFFYTLTLPPFQSVDEGMHFYRTYQISQGRFIAQNIDGKVGDYLPKDLSEFYKTYEPFIKNIDRKQTLDNIKKDFKYIADDNDLVFTQFTNTALYSPVCYVSQLPGVLVGKMLKLPLVGIYYLGRLSNLISYCFLIFLALKLAPFFRLPMFLLALMPMSLSLAGAYTCDVAVLGLNFIWMAMILRLLEKDECQRKDIIWMSVIAFLITLSKSYILLLPLVFLIPMSKFKNKKDYILSLCLILIAALTAGAIWYLSSKGLKLDMNEVFADSAMQKLFIMSHPFEFIGVLIKTFFVKTPRLYITMIGVLGWQDTKLDWITYIVYPVLLYFAVFADTSKFILNRWQKLIVLADLLFGIVLTYTSLYIMWSP